MDPLNSCHFGKYGSMVNISMTGKNEKYQVKLNLYSISDIM